MEDPKTTDRMRHIPSLDYLISYVDQRFRQRADLYYQSAFGTAHEDRDLEHEIEQQLRSFIGALVDISVAAGKPAKSHKQDHLRVALESVLDETVDALRSIEPEQFGRRAPADQFDRSRAEPIFSRFLAATSRLNDLLPMVRDLDPDAPMKLLELESPREMPTLASAPTLTEWK
ncbi:MAG: hypothetical protein R3338_07825 [Thermoanaerobaculia bacterium]|nr:hypothetical protein [Thermoanaerobaculia bacterium]